MNAALSYLGRLRHGEFSPAAYRRWLYATLGWLVLVVATGAIVRMSGSGLGCDNWPRCGQLPVPTEAATYHPIIEFSNRMLALAAIISAVITWLIARRVPGIKGWVRRLTGLIALLIVLQIPLGGITVLTGLHPLAVMAHFLLTIVVLAMTIYIELEISREQHGAVAPLVPLAVRRLGLLMLLAASALVVTGAVSTASGPHPGASQEVDRLFTVDGSLWFHVRANAVYGIVLAILIATLWVRRAAAPRLLASAVGLVLLLAGQMVLGEVQYRSGLPAWMVVVHVTVSGFVWAWTAWLVGALWRPSTYLTQPLPGSLGRRLAGLPAAEA